MSHRYGLGPRKDDDSTHVAPKATLHKREPEKPRPDVREDTRPIDIRSRSCRYPRAIAFTASALLYPVTLLLLRHFSRTSELAMVVLAYALIYVFPLLILMLALAIGALFIGRRYHVTDTVILGLGVGAAISSVLFLWLILGL